MFSIGSSKKKTIAIGALSILGALVVFLVFPEILFRTLSAFRKPEAASEVVETPVEISETREPNYVYVDSLDLKAPLNFITETNEKAYQEALQHGVVHFPGTALPGQPGNVYIFGHSSDLPWSKGQYKTIFAPIVKMSAGDEIVLTDGEGKVFHYKVFETKIVSPKDTSVLDQGNYERKLLTLQTSYPIGTALQRFLVIAELMQ